MLLQFKIKIREIYCYYKHNSIILLIFLVRLTRYSSIPYQSSIIASVLSGKERTSLRMIRPSRTIEINSVN